MKLATFLYAATALAGLAAGAQAATIGPWGVDLTAIDTRADPGDDFFRYVNGSWLDRTEIDPDKTIVGMAAAVVDKAEQQVRDIVEAMAKNPSAPGTVGQQVGDLYASWMDEAAIEARGTAPLKPYLARIEAIHDRGTLLRALVRPGATSPIGTTILPDPEDPTRNAISVFQSGLGMPNRDYYLLQDERYQGYRRAYRDYVEKLLQLSSMSDAGKRADAILALEERIAKAHWTAERSRDVKQTYNPMTVAQLTALAPQYEWPLLLQAAGLGKADRLIVDQPSTVADTGKLLDEIPLPVWKDYLAFHFIRANASYLPKAFDEADFDFYAKTLRGVKAQRDRWKRGIQLVNATLGEAVGKIYVERHYPPQSSAQMAEMIGNLRTAFKQRLEKLDWMDDATRKGALAKLATFEPLIGHPRKWTDYSALKIDRSDLLGNMVRAQEFSRNLELSWLRGPVDRGLWYITPQTVDAYYIALLNQIAFPAAILQPPFFDPTADPAINYGGIGAAIGHEIGHGFDDQGRQYDEKGKLRDWWTKAATERFSERSARLTEQYSAFEPFPGAKVNGKLTLGENIGDLGGLQMAYSAYRLHVAKHGEPPVLNGFTGDQRFFLAFAQAWRSKQREGAMREMMLTNPHSPRPYRVNGVVRNFDEWYKAFNVTPDDDLYLPPEKRVRIW